METFQSEDDSHGKTCTRCGPNHIVTLQLDHQETMFAKLRVCSANEGLLKSRS